MRRKCKTPANCGNDAESRQQARNRALRAARGAVPVSGGAFSDWIAPLLAVSRARGRILAVPAADGQEKCAGDGEGKAGPAGAVPLEALNKAIPAFSAHAALQHVAALCTGKGVCSLHHESTAPAVVASGGT